MYAHILSVCITFTESSVYTEEKNPFFRSCRIKCAVLVHRAQRAPTQEKGTREKKNVRHQTSLASYMLLTDVEHLYNWVVVEPPL